jgi:hypothetical protein
MNIFEELGIWPFPYKNKMIDSSVAPIQNMCNRPHYSGQYCIAGRVRLLKIVGMIPI